MTDDNPYRFAAVEVERDDDVAAESTFRQPTTGRKLSANDVRILAFSQRGLWICAAPMALLSFVWTLNIVAPGVLPFGLSVIPKNAEPLFMVLFAALGAVLLVAWLGSLVYVLAIASRTHPTWLSFVIWFFAIMIPPVMLLMLPYLQSRAARELRRHGIPANLFRAEMKSLPRLDATPPKSS